jgi:hypothetical protein
MRGLPLERRSKIIDILLVRAFDLSLSACLTIRCVIKTEKLFLYESYEFFRVGGVFEL